MADDNENVEKVLDLLARGDGELDALLIELQPYDLAQVLERIPGDAVRLSFLQRCPDELAAGALEHLDFDDQYALLAHMPEERAGILLSEMSNDAVADLVLAIHPRQARGVLSLVPPDDLHEVRELMTYPENTVGSRMTTDFIAVRQRWTAQRVIEHFRRVGAEAEIAHYLYVVDRDNHLIGVTSMRDVILSEPSTPVSDIMTTQLISAHTTDDQEEAARVLMQYDFGALPVVHADGRLAGVLSVDDVLDVAEEEATEDFHKGASVLPLRGTYRQAGVVALYNRRVWWLAALVVLSLLSMGVIANFEDQLSRAVILVSFIPLLVASGGNSGSQSAALMIRALATDDVKMSEWARVFFKEMGVGLLLGGTLGALAWVLGIFRGDATVGLVVGISMMSIVLVANIIGMSLPFILNRIRVDPAVASAPLITTMIDALGLLIYFSVAVWLLNL